MVDGAPALQTKDAAHQPGPRFPVQFLPGLNQIHFTSASNERGVQWRSAFTEIGKVEPGVAVVVAACDQDSVTSLSIQLLGPCKLRGDRIGY